MHRSRDNYQFLTTAPIPRVIATMAIPAVISMLVTSVYNIVDTFFIGQISTQATAAVGIVFSVMFVIQAVGFFFGHGSGNYIARELGARRQQNAESMAATGLVYSFSFGLLIAVLGQIFLHPLSVMLGSTPTILPYTEDYMRLILLGAPLQTAALTMNNQMRFQGNANYAMYGITAGAVLNVALDPLFIFVCNMGVRGAALATLLGQVCSFCILFIMTHHGGNIRIRLRNFSRQSAFVREILRGGTPSLFRQVVACFAAILMNRAAGVYGDAAIAAMAIVNRISMIIMSIIIGVGHGFQPLCGFSYGAGLYRRVRQGYWFVVKIGTGFLLVCTVLVFCFSSDLITIFRNDPAVIAIGTDALHWQILSWPLEAVFMMSNMLLQTIGMSLRANILALSKRGFFFVPFILILPYYFGLTGIEVCQPVCDVCGFLLTIPIAVASFKILRNEPAAHS